MHPKSKVKTVLNFTYTLRMIIIQGGRM